MIDVQKRTARQSKWDSANTRKVKISHKRIYSKP